MIEMREQFGIAIVAAHLNHRLRGAESDRDENFVREMCAKLNVQLIIERADGLDAASSNLEERARAARHEFLNRAAEGNGAEYVALAHHSGDQGRAGLIGLAAVAVDNLAGILVIYPLFPPAVFPLRL